MIDISELIEFGSECDYLDFKAVQYLTTKHGELIKDVVSFANSDVKDEKFIICGVRNKNSEKYFDGINPSEMFDSARYNQLIRDNIEPDIDIEYFLHEYKGKYFAVLKISGCNDKPYMMKKEFKHRNEDAILLKKGDSWIRKGSHNTEMMRRDIDRILNEKIESRSFSGDIKILFLDTNSENMTITKKAIKLKSEIEKGKIQEIIERHQKTKSSNPILQSVPLLHIPTIFSDVLGSDNYNSMSTDELIELLPKIEAKFKAYDDYIKYEFYATEINLRIENLGDEYIDDLTIQISVPKINGLNIPDCVLDKPLDRRNLFVNPVLPTNNYPDVKYNENSIVISEDLKLLKHGIPELLFIDPLRVTVTEECETDNIIIVCKIIGRNLPKPIEKKLNIKIE